MEQCEPSTGETGWKSGRALYGSERRRRQDESIKSDGYEELNSPTTSSIGWEEAGGK